MNTQIIAIANQKGGVGKTTTCANLGIGLAQTGKKVLLIDGDPQGSLTISLGHPQPDKLPFTLSDAMGRILMDEPLRPGEGILHHPEGVDLMPADIQLSGMEVSLVNAMSRETILRQYLDTLKGQYSHKPLTHQQPTTNRAFQEMRKPALDRLADRVPEELSARTGIPFDRQRQVFSLSSLGRNMEIDYPGYEIRPAVDDWHHLLILHYLDLADGTPLSHQLMAFGDLPSGMVRGGGFDRQSERDLGLRLGHVPQAQVERACRALGGVLTPSNADVCAVFSLFPNYPITLKLWFADEEIPGSGRLFLDRSASHYLTVEDAVTAGSVLMEALFQELNASR